MSVEALNYSHRVKVGNTTAKFVLTRLADRADERFSCFPSVPLIAAEVEVSERSVQRALTLLRDLCLVSDRPQYRADGSQTTSRYTLHGPWDDYAGTGVPFPEIVTPKQARADLWAQAPAEAPFREGTAAAVVLSGDPDEVEAAAQRAVDAMARTAAARESKKSRGRKAAASKATRTSTPDPSEVVSAGGEGVTQMSPPPVTSVSPPPVSLVSPLESTFTIPTTEPTRAPSARSAGDVRRTSAGSSACERANGGSAASGKESSSSEGEGVVLAGTDVPQQRTEHPELTGEQVAVVKAVIASLPGALVERLPYRSLPKHNRPQFLAAMAGRTTAQIIDRATRRWVQHGYADALHSLEGKGIRSAVGVAVALVEAGECPHPRCEDGFHIDTGEQCRVCEERRAERRAAKKAAAAAGENTGTVRQAPHRPGWWECNICQAPGRGQAPTGGECTRCQTEAAEAMERIAARWEQETADRVKVEEGALLAVEEAAARRQAEDRRQAAELAARKQAADEETARIRAELVAQYPELAAVSESTSTAPF